MSLRAFATTLSLSLALAAQSPRTNPPAAPGGAAPPATAQQQVEALLAAFGRSDAVAFWDWLPMTWQHDVETIAHELADHLDAKTYDRAAKLVQRCARAAIAKQEFVFGNQTIANLMQQNGADPQSAREVYAALAGMLQQLAGGELGSVEGLRAFDGRRFASRSGKALLETVLALGRATGDDPLAELETVRVRTVGKGDGQERVELSAPGRPAEVTTFVRVEGRWVPTEMADGWDENVRDVRRKIAAMPKNGDPKFAAQTGLVLGMLEAFVQQLESVESQAEFDALCAQTMAMANGGARRGR